MTAADAATLIAAITALIVAVVSAFKGVRKGEFDSLTSSINLLRDENERLSAENKMLRADFGADNKRIDALEREKDENERRIKELERDIAALLESNKALTEEVNNLKSSNAALKDENNRLRVRLAGLEKRESEGMNGKPPEPSQ